MAAALPKHKKVLQNLFKEIKFEKKIPYNKITIVGAGRIGSTCAFSLLEKGITNEIVFVDTDQEKALGEKLDLELGVGFLGHANISSSSDYSTTIGSRICIITAGYRQISGASRIEMIERNTAIMKDVIPKLMEHNPDTILVVVTNPVDIMSFVAWKLSRLPYNHVIGLGNIIATSHFHHLIAQRLKIATSCIDGWIIGENGSHCVAVWSTVNMAGMQFKDINPAVGTKNDQENWKEVHREVKNIWNDVKDLKGDANWSTALGVSAICSAIVKNSGTIHSVSTFVQGLYCIKEEVFFSLPCAIGANGVSYTLKLVLSETEMSMLVESAAILQDLQMDLNI